jgi:hypothetical protein
MKNHLGPITIPCLMKPTLETPTPLQRVGRLLRRLANSIDGSRTIVYQLNARPLTDLGLTDAELKEMELAACSFLVDMMNARIKEAAIDRVLDKTDFRG